MDCYEIEEVSWHARIYKIKCKTSRIGDGSDFEYQIDFSEKLDLGFTNARAAMLFIDAIVKEKSLLNTESRTVLDSDGSCPDIKK